MPHDKDLTHWHEPSGNKKAGFGTFRSSPRRTTPSWRARAFRCSATSASARCRTCRCSRGSAPAARATSSSSRHRDQVGLLRRGSAAGRRAAPAEAHVRGDLPRGRRPRHHRGLAGRRHQEACLRVAEGLDVLDPDERLVPHRQRHQRRRAAAGRQHGAERAEHDQQRRRGLQQPVSCSATASTAPTTSSSRRTTSSPTRSAAWPCGAPTSSPTSSTASCRWTTGAARAGAASNPS